MSTSRVLPLLALLCLAGCCYWVSGPHSPLLNDLTQDDWELVCELEFDEAEDRVVDCDGTEVVYEATSVEDCLEDAALFTVECDANFEDWRGCQESLELNDAQVCGDEEVWVSTDCERVDACMSSDE